MARAKQDEKKELLKVLYHPHLLHGMASNQIPPSSDPLLAPSSPTPAPRELRRSTSYYKPDTYAPPRNPSTMPLQSHKTAPTENSAPIHRPPPVTLTALKKKTPEQSKENIDPSPPKAKSSDKKKREREEGADHSAERASKKTRATLGQRNGPNASTPAVQVERPGTPPMPTAGPIVPRTPNDMPNVQPATPLPKTPLRKSASRASHCSPTPRGFQHLADPMSDLFSPMTPKQLGAYSAPAPFTPRTKATAEALNLGFDDVESWPSSQATTVAADSEPITAVPNTSNRWSDLPPSSPPPPSSPSPAPAPEEAQQSLNLFGFSDDDEINLEGFETYIPTDPQRGDDDVDYYSGLLSSDVDFSKINMEEVLRSLSDGMSGDSTAFEEGEEKVGGSASACVATKIQELYSGCVV
ncbi:hypothetical protein SISSUDRAFT_181061 [Sistotremastrum suecicum HHB10207 ss-3]|nr:hypothetical protein SISSUDRAFT_181061 [Sistotremastrum suecicum HHB10207 ss-3]